MALPLMPFAPVMKADLPMTKSDLCDSAFDNVDKSESVGCGLVRSSKYTKTLTTSIILHCTRTAMPVDTKFG